MEHNSLTQAECNFVAFATKMGLQGLTLQEQAYLKKLLEKYIKGENRPCSN
jgi:hypothetical protein